MLKVNYISKTFNPGTINEKKALDNLSLHLKEGDFVTVIGSNGAGKSSVLNAIAGVWPVDNGSIVLAGEDITGLPEYLRAKLIGRVFQDPMMGTAPDMWIEENLAIAMRRGEKRRLKWMVSKQDRELYREKLKELGLGLEDRLQVKVGLLSGGQRQALTLLMATLKSPKLLLLDEHTAALDPKTAAKVLHLTRDLVRDHHLTALMVTHNMKDALQYGNRIVMMHEGKVIVDVNRETKSMLRVEDLLAMFEHTSGAALDNDRMLLG